MEENKHCEYFGTLEKIEEFTTLSQNCIPGSLVFESLSPFLGYYNEYPHDYSPLYIYIAVDKIYPVFDVVRAFQKVKKEIGFDLDVAKAFVHFNDRNYNVIRLRHLDGYDRIHEIQEAFQRYGIKPLMNSHRWEKISVHVSLRKVFCLSPLAEGLFLDACEENHAYIQIPKALNFDEFLELTKRVKNNWLEFKFDAALGYYLKENEVVEIVRIYSKRLDLPDLKGIQKLYLQKIR
jgi:hypothetical protein